MGREMEIGTMIEMGLDGMGWDGMGWDGDRDGDGDGHLWPQGLLVCRYRVPWASCQVWAPPVLRGVCPLVPKLWGPRLWVGCGADPPCQPVPSAHSELILSNIHVSANGEWECAVSTSQGNVSKKVEIVVLETSASYCPAERVTNNRGDFRWAPAVARPRGGCRGRAGACVWREQCVPGRGLAAGDRASGSD